MPGVLPYNVDMSAGIRKGKTVDITSRTKRERLEAWVTSEQLALFQHTADLQGLSLADFVVSAVQSAAEETARQHRVITLSARDSLIFVEALLNPPQPNEYARLAAEEYRVFAGNSL